MNPMLFATSLKHCLQSIKLYVRINPLYEPHLLHHLPPLPCASLFLPVSSYSLGFGIYLFNLYSIFLLKELDCLFSVYPVCLTYLGTLPGLFCDPISGSIEHNINVHSKDSNVRIVLCTWNIYVLMY